MKTIRINKSDIQGPFVCPPELAGTPQATSFACTEDYILGSRGGEITAYHWPKRGEFSPANQAPKLGRRAGNVALT